MVMVFLRADGRPGLPQGGAQRGKAGPVALPVQPWRGLFPGGVNSLLIVAQWVMLRACSSKWHWWALASHEALLLPQFARAAGAPLPCQRRRLEAARRGQARADPLPPGQSPRPRGQPRLLETAGPPGAARARRCRRSTPPRSRAPLGGPPPPAAAAAAPLPAAGPPSGGA